LPSASIYIERGLAVIDIYMAFCEGMVPPEKLGTLPHSFPSNRGLLESLSRHPYVGFLFRCYSDPGFHYIAFACIMITRLCKALA
jgi:hypothetical protein